MMDEEAIIHVLVDQYQYSISEAGRVAKKMLQLREPLFSLFLNWWSLSSIPEVEIEGYTFKALISDKGMNPFTAFITLNWLLIDPETAKETLSKGYDKVSRQE